MPRELSSSNAKRAIVFKSPRGPLHLQPTRGPSSSNAKRVIIFKRLEDHHLQTADRVIVSSNR
ncbi:hypothetical protein KY284_032908 [Solanum tuberosum]|nr:hypothetical protein KY284_032908 [Solanum tuberosum]